MEMPAFGFIFTNGTDFERRPCQSIFVSLAWRLVGSHHPDEELIAATYHLISTVFLKFRGLQALSFGNLKGKSEYMKKGKFFCAVELKPISFQRVNFKTEFFGFNEILTFSK